MPTLNGAKAVLLGSTSAQAVYLGESKVWPPKMKWRFTIAADWNAHIASASDGTAAFDFNRVNLDKVDADGFAIRAQPWGSGANPYIIIRNADGVVRYSGVPDNGHFSGENMLIILNPRPDFGALRTALGGTGASFTVEFGQGPRPEIYRWVYAGDNVWDPTAGKFAVATGGNAHRWVFAPTDTDGKLMPDPLTTAIFATYTVEGPSADTGPHTVSVWVRRPSLVWEARNTAPSTLGFITNEMYIVTFFPPE